MKKLFGNRFFILTTAALLSLLLLLSALSSCNDKKDDAPGSTTAGTAITTSDITPEHTATDTGDVTTVTTDADATVITGTQDPVADDTTLENQTDKTTTTSEETTIIPETTGIQTTTDIETTEEITTVTETEEPDTTEETDISLDTAENEATMPIINITTAGGISSSDTYTQCTVTVNNCTGKCIIDEASAGIRIRGNSTAGAPKKPYRVKFDSKINMLGLNDGAKCKSWVLMADYYDPSLMRTMTAFNLAGTIVGDAAYTSDFCHVEVYINGEYNGVYLLCEQTQINKHRVAIMEKEDTYTGTDVGYLLVGQGGRTDEPNTVTFSCSVPLTDTYGNTKNAGLANFSLASGDYTEEQISYIRNWISAVYTLTYEAIYNNKYYSLNESDCTLTKKTVFEWAKTDEEKQQETIGCVMALDAAVRMYMLDEIVKDLDSGTYNMYADLSPTGEHKLYFGAPWDFDFALGNTKWGSLASKTGLYACSFLVSDGVRQNTWYVLLYHAQWFRDMVKNVWAQVYDSLLEDAQDILDYADKYKAQYTRNFEKWQILGKYTLDWHQNPVVLEFRTHNDAAVYLKNWLVSRLHWLNTIWGDGQLIENNVTFNMSDDYSQYFHSFNNCKGTQSESGYKISLTDTRDPYVSFDIEPFATVNSNEYQYIEITYKASSTKNRVTEIFIAAGDTYGPEGGKSVTFEIICDKKEHTAKVPLNDLPFWNGMLHMIRIDCFSATDNVNDTFILKSISFVGTQY